MNNEDVKKVIDISKRIEMLKESENDLLYIKSIVRGDCGFTFSELLSLINGKCSRYPRLLDIFFKNFSKAVDTLIEENNKEIAEKEKELEML